MMQAICSDAEGFLVALMSFIAGYLALLSWGEGVREWGKSYNPSRTSKVRWLSCANPVIRIPASAKVGMFHFAGTT